MRLISKLNSLTQFRPTTNIAHKFTRHHTNSTGIIEAKPSSAGIIETKPYKFSFGLIPVCMVMWTFMYCGAMAAKRGAALLEEWDIFVPEDDDDD